MGSAAAGTRPGAAAEHPRAPFRRRRRGALAWSALLFLTLAAVGWLLLAPRDLASVRLFEVSLGWWAALVAYAVGALAVARPRRGGTPRGAR